MKRCFVGLSIEDAARARLAELCAELSALPRSAARRLRPVRPESLHATIKFLGATADAELPALAQALAEVARGLPPAPPVRLEGLGAFPSATKPHVVFAAVGLGREWLVELARRVEEASVILGFPPEERPHVPHVTLARVEGATARGPLSAWLAAAGGQDLGRISTRSLVLFESVRDAAGSRYVQIQGAPLG